MTEPKYDEDSVNLGYLKKVISNTEENIENTYKDVSRHYASKPKPPYYEGDTWIDGNIVYTCINSREIGLYVDSDWTTESGAKQEAERKNKIYLTQPSNYSAGDMWILQSDNDHQAGKKGEILITTAGRKEYDANDWVNMLGYGTIRSINEVANNLNNAINRIGDVEEAIEDGLIVTFYQGTVPEAKHVGDLWYVTAEIEGYIKGKIYRYNGTEWEMLDDPAIQEAFDEANEARLVADGKIQSFYSNTEPTENVGVGDLWIDLGNNNQLYRYNGTNWVAVYDTRIDELVTDVNSVTERVTTVETDLGKIELTVQETETKVITLEGEVEDANATITETNNKLVQYTQDLEGFGFKIEEAGGINLIKNSTLEDGLNLYHTTTGTLTIEKNMDIKENTTSKTAVKIIEGSIATENINIIAGQKYTFSCLIYKTELTNVKVRVITDIIKEYVVEIEPKTWQKFTANFNSSVNTVMIEIIADNNFCYISDMILNKGDTALGWQRHAGEFRSDTVIINELGMTVENSTDNVKHVMTASENKIINTLNGKTTVTFNADKTIMTSVDIQEKATKGKVRETVRDDGTVMVTMDD